MNETLDFVVLSKFKVLRRFFNSTSHRLSAGESRGLFTIVFRIRATAFPNFSCFIGVLLPRSPRGDVLFEVFKQPRKVGRCICFAYSSANSLRNPGNKLVGEEVGLDDARARFEPFRIFPRCCKQAPLKR